MAETIKNKDIEQEKYSFYVPEDPEAAKKMEEKAWHHRKLKKVIVNDYILSYSELLEMRMVFESQLESFESDLEIKYEQIEGLKKKIEEYKNKVKEWTEEIEAAERDIPEIGQKAAEERRVDAEKKAKHEANLRGEGEGRAFEPDAAGNLVDKTGTKAS